MNTQHCAPGPGSADRVSTHSLQAFIERHAPLFILTGAGCSTDSGIPDYRDTAGAWKRPQPMTLQRFLRDQQGRQRYWARSLLGWPRMRDARPNAAHGALACLEQRRRMQVLVTQNVDRLHQAGGSERVIDLHGRIDRVRCLSCTDTSDRAALQSELLARNPEWANLTASAAPDGDAALEGRDFSRFEVPVCRHCGGVLKPDVVFFGESVPSARVEAAMAHLQDSAGVLVVGSSLMVLSGYRFVRAAAEAGKPIAAINLGRTRADDLLTLKVSESCAHALAFALPQVAANRFAAAAPGELAASAGV
jgi:NAD-dependent SIR2 family protein deacetylase